jgi:hypothetical protein
MASTFYYRDWVRTQRIYTEGSPANAFDFAGSPTQNQIAITGTWGDGITNAAISIGDYSTAYSIGSTSEHKLGIVSHLSATIDDASNMIPLMGAFTVGADSASATAQCILGKGVCAYDIADMYGVRGSITVSGSPAVNQIFGLYSTLTLSTTCVIAATGNVAGAAIQIDGAVDVTRDSGSDAHVSGIWVNWRAKSIASVGAYGVRVGVAGTVGEMDSAFRLDGSGATDQMLECANTAVTYFAKYSASCNFADTTSGGGTRQGRIAIQIGSDKRYLYVYSD